MSDASAREMDDDSLKVDALPVGNEPLSQAIWSRIVEYDEALAAGRSLDLHDDDSVRQLSPAGQEQVFEVLDCLDFLGRVRSQKRDGKGGTEVGRSQGATEGESDPAPPRLTIGRFEVLHEIGSGGHGVVFCANDPILRRPVALKVPRPEFLFSKGMRRRFVAEAQAAAALDHPNIVRVLDAGLDGTVCYIAQELCTGPSLSALLKERPGDLTPQIAAQLVRDLAKGLDHAHQHGILHRDLKPANVLLKSLDGDAKAGPHADHAPVIPRPDMAASFPFTPKLCDFGICKAFDDDDDSRTVTRTGTVIGTAAYMSPEQAAGKASGIGAQSDVYGLGAVLYEMLTGHPPFQGESQIDVLRRVVNEEPAPIRSSHPDVPRDLQAVCLKCLEKSPEQRYGTAAELADDLQRFLNGEAVHARPAGPVQRLVKQVRRRRRSVKIVAVLLFSGWLAALVGIWLQVRLLTESPVANPPLVLPSPAKVYISDIRGAFNLWNESEERLRNNPDAADEMTALLARHVPQAGQVDRRRFDWHYLWRLCHPAEAVGSLRRVSTIKGHEADVYFVTFSRDGSRLASASRDKTARVWDVATGQQICVCRGHTNEVNWVDFSPDQKLLATASDDHTVRIWDAVTGQERFTLKGHATEVVTTLFSPTANVLVSGDDSGILKMWDLSSRRQLKSVAAHRRRIQALSWVAEGHLLATAGDDETNRLWAMPDMVLRSVQNCAGAHCASLSPDGELLASSAGGGTITVDDVNTGGRRMTFSGDFRNIEAIRFSPDGHQIASCCGDGTLWLWDLPTRRGWIAVTEKASAAKSVNPLSLGLWCLAYSHDGTRLATSRRDGLVEVFDTSVNPQWTLLTKDPPNSAPSDLAFSPDGKRLAISWKGEVPAKGGLQIWDASALRPTVLLERGGTRSRGVCFSNDGSELALGFDDNVDILSNDTLQTKSQIRCPAVGETSLVAFDGRGSLFAVQHPPRVLKWTVHVYDIKRGEETRTIGAPFDWGLGFAESSDHELLATCKSGDAPQVALYESRTGRLRTKAIGRRGMTSHLAFAPTAPMLALAAKGGVELWDTGDGHEIGFLSGMGPENGPVAFSADGRLLFVVSFNEKSVHLWDVEQRVQLFTLRLPLEFTVKASEWLLAVSPDGKKIAFSVRNADGNGGVFLFSGLPTAAN
jgi:WD40 repeat protein/serine/threonine protein kinase